MSENLTVYESTDRLATMSDDGIVRIWLIGSDGLPRLKEGPGWLWFECRGCGQSMNGQIEAGQHETATGHQVIKMIGDEA